MRVTGVFAPGDHPDPARAADVEALFATLFPGVAEPRFDAAHAGLAIAAHHPGVALQLATLSRTLALDTRWCRRADLRELAIQTVNLHFRSHASFEARLPAAAAAGVRPELLAALPYWRRSTLFDDEQRLVVEYSEAVASGDVPAELFARIVAAYGETGAVECTTVIAIWSAWAMILNAAGPGLDPG